MTSEIGTRILINVLQNKLPSSAKYLGLDVSIANQAEVERLPEAVKKGNVSEAILYLKDLAHGSIQSFKCRLMVMGFSGIGKSSLVRALIPLEAKFMKKGLLPRSTPSSILLYGPYLFVDDRCKLFLDDRLTCNVDERTSSLLLSFARNDTVDIFDFSMSTDTSFEKCDRLDEAGVDQMSKVGVVLNFESNPRLLSEWSSYIKHWVRNAPTVGIELSCLKVPYDKDNRFSMELSVFDFAGHEEFVLYFVNEIDDQRFFSLQRHFLGDCIVYMVC